VARRLVLGQKFASALEAADEAIAVGPDEIRLYANRAHALMFLGRTDEARELYLKYRGEKALDEKSWDAVILEDFAEMRKIGLTNSLMEENREAFAAP